MPLFLFITIDPEQDRPEILTRYFQGFSNSFLPLTGGKGQIEAVRQFFQIQTSRPATGSIEHTDAVFLINPTGRIVLVYPHVPAEAETLLADLALMEETNL